VRRRIEDVQSNARVRILVQGSDLRSATATCEVTDGEAHLRKIDLPGSGVIDALRAVEREGRSVRLEVVDAHVEILVLVRDEDSVMLVRRKLPRHDVARTAPHVVVA